MTQISSVAHGTAVEQSRAVAEVFAAAELAMRMPRDEARAEELMRAACSRRSLAEGAEYALPRSGSADITGPTVQLARELARIWRNITHGVVEISRDNDRGQSELMAFAWDVENNVRSARTFIVPHTRDKTQWDKRGGRNVKVGTVAEPLGTQQDITNQNNSVGARQLRETIFSVLPQWFTEDAIEACKRTLVAVERGEMPSTPREADRSKLNLGDRVRVAVESWSANGVTVPQLEAWLGDPRHQWTDDSLARLATLWRSLRDGEAKLSEVFPVAPLTVDAIPAADAPLAAEYAAPVEQPAVFGQARPEPSDLDLEPTEAEIAAARGEQHG